jgi:iron complex transport system substrate-binding protein
MNSAAARRWTVVLAMALLPAGCNDEAPLPDAAHPRIVSNSPALTQMLFDMGLGDHVVGVTTQCELPAGQTRPTVGAAIDIDAEAILSLQPHVVLTQTKLDRFQAVQNVAPEIRFEHFRFDSLSDIAAALQRIGEIAGCPEVGKAARGDFEAKLDAIRRRVAGRPRPRVMFVYGHDRPATSGRNTFVDDMIGLAGGVNVAAEQYDGWKKVNVEQVLVLKPDVLICQTDAGEEARSRKAWLSLTGLPAADSGRVYVVTDRHLTIPSTRSAGLAADIAAMLHPQADTAEGGQP